MRTRMLRPPEESFFLLGPRGTGKSTWVRGSYPDAVTVDLLEAGLFQRLAADPSRLSSLLPKADARSSSKGVPWVIIDEVQRVPDILNEVHRLIEQRRGRFALTGSSARKLRRGGVNLLAGRARSYAMHPFAPEELGEDFDLAHALEFGLLPMATEVGDPRVYLQSYVQTYLQEEVLQEGLTRNLGAFSRFLEAASFSQGSTLNISEVARECEVGRKMAEGYFHILEDLMLAHRLPVFSRRAKRKLTRHPKFYLFDTGVYRALRPRGPLDRPVEITGMALETLVLQSLLAVNATLEEPYQVSFWRTSAGSEVDLVLYGPRGFFAIEVKAHAKPQPKDFRGLKSFASDYPEARKMLLYMGEREMTEADAIEVVPVAKFLRQCSRYLGQGGA